MTVLPVANTKDRTSLKGDIDLVTLAQMVKQRRSKMGLKQEEVGASWGYAASTVSRIEQVKIIKPDPRLLTAICTWLGVPMSRFLSGNGELTDDKLEKVPLSLGLANIPDSIEVYLRASKDLHADQVDVLARVFRDVFDAVTRGGNQ